MSDAPVSRRARLRARTTAEILEVARAHLAADGASALSLRAIARDLDMGVSSLYRYFASRDDLLTELLVAAFNDQADAVDVAAQSHADPADSLRCASRAYRQWALDHPPEFALAYGTPIPGYAAPADRTVSAAVRVGGTFIEAMHRAWDAGRIDRTRVDERASSLTPVERSGLEALMGRRDYPLPVGLMSLVVDSFIRIHGFVVMEAFGQLRPLAADPAATFDRAVDDALSAVGLS